MNQEEYITRIEVLIIRLEFYLLVYLINHFQF